MPMTESPNASPVQSPQSVQSGFWGSLVRSLRLDDSLFEQVEHDPGSLTHASTVVLVAGLARGLYGAPMEGAVALVGSLAGAVILWFVAAGVLTLVGGRWFRGTTNFSEMLRTLGFAAAPLWFLAPGFFLPGSAHVTLGALVHLWAIVAAVVAARAALDLTTGKALAACAASIGLGLFLLFLMGAFVRNFSAT
jgi:hypothetical protein